MATPSEHEGKALHNEEFVRQHNLGSGAFADWAVIGLFYSAVHWLRALILREGYGVVDNYGEEDRAAEDLIRHGALSREAWGWYRHLKDDSRTARYDVKNLTPADFDHIYKTSFDPFRAFMLAKLQITQSG